MCPKMFSCGHLMKIQWFITDVTAVGSPDRAERDLSIYLSFFLFFFRSFFLSINLSIYLKSILTVIGNRAPYSSAEYCHRPAMLVRVSDLQVIGVLRPWRAGSITYVSIHLSIRLSMYLSICPSIRLSIYPSIHLSINTTICLFIYLSIHIFYYLSFHLSQQKTISCVNYLLSSDIY